MKRDVRVGVIGTGALGRHHARLYGECEGCVVAGVYDVNRENAEKVAGEFGLRLFQSMDELVAATDALSVAVPTDLHHDVVTRLLRADRHVLVEKPLAGTSAQGRAMVDEASQRGLVLQVGHVERFNPVVKFIEENLTVPRFIEAHRLAAYPPPRPGLRPRGTEVGVVLDLMIHDIEVILHLVKSPVKRLEAVGIPVLSLTEDIANARLTFENGCIANITASRVSAEPTRKIRLFQSDAYFSLDYGARKGEMVSCRDGTVAREQLPIGDHNALQKQLENFVTCVDQALAGRKPLALQVSGEVGLRALEVAEEIVEAVNRHNQSHGL